MVKAAPTVTLNSDILQELKCMPPTPPCTPQPTLPKTVDKHPSYIILLSASNNTRAALFLPLPSVLFKGLSHSLPLPTGCGANTLAVWTHSFRLRAHTHVNTLTLHTGYGHHPIYFYPSPSVLDKHPISSTHPHQF